MADLEILEAVVDAFNRRHRIGDEVRVKSEFPGTKLRRKPPTMRKIKAPGAYILGGAVVVALAGKDPYLLLGRVTWND